MSFLEPICAHIAERSSAYILVSLVLGVGSAVVSFVALGRFRAAVRPFSRIRPSSDDPGQLLPAVLRLAEDSDAKLESMAARLDNHIEESRRFIKYAGLVRYDAFEDIGGQQSFSMCLLDDRKNGVLVTYLTGKSSTRSYAVAIENGEAPRKLSDEEARVLDEAVSSDVLTHAQ